jgi:hypothetical protein
LTGFFFGFSSVFFLAGAELEAFLGVSGFFSWPAVRARANMSWVLWIGRASRRGEGRRGGREGGRERGREGGREREFANDDEEREAGGYAGHQRDGSH